MAQTVLVADDSKTIRRIVEMALKASEYEVVGVDSAQAAMNSAASASIIVLDYYMPDGSGYDVCRALKANAATSAIPVLMLGGTYKNFDENLARQSGADGVLMKPFKTDMLIDALRSVGNGAGAPIAAVAEPEPVFTPEPVYEPEPAYTAPDPVDSPRTMPIEPEQIVSASQPRIPVDKAQPKPVQTAPPESGARSGSGLAALGLSRAEIETLVREEVKAAVRSELPTLLRTVMGDIFQQKVLPKLLERADQRVQQAVESGVDQKIQQQVREELERLLSED